MGARIPRKKGQPANSKKHSDLYTDENPKGTIHGLGFKNPAKARQSLVKIKNSSRSHAHKTQAAIAMEQRAREMGKTTEANIYRRFIEQQKKKTKQMNKMDLAMQLLKEFYIGQGEDGEGYHSPEGHLPNYGMKPNQWAYTAQNPNTPLEPNPQDPNQYLRGGSSPRLQDSGSFVGARVGKDTTDSDESIAHLANVLGHEFTHNLIEDEIENFATEKFGSPQPIAPIYDENKSNNPFARRPVLNQSEIDADNQRLALRQQAKSFAHEYGAHQSDQPSQAHVNAMLAGRPDTANVYNQMRTNQFGYYPSMQEQQQIASMMPPQPQMVQTGEPMDLAWRLLKAPYDVYSHEGYKKEPFEGTLYAGGDVTDTPKYYTPSLENALDYAVYGSATGDVPMRGTTPVIRVAQDPGFNKEGQPAGRLITDPKLRDAYIQDDDFPLQTELMDDYILQQLISQMPDKSPKSDTTGYYHSQQDRNKHIQGALERLKNKTSGRLDLTDSEKEIGGISTGRHDELDMMDFDDINSGWDFLEDWERRWLLNNRFDELPMWVQEQYRDDVRTGEPMDIAMRLLKMPPMWYGDGYGIMEKEPPMNQDFTMLNTMDWALDPNSFQQAWESDDGVARGIAIPNHNDGTWAISHFEIADDLQGLGAGQKYLERFIDELREDEYPHEEGFHPYDGELKPYDVHVVQVEPHAFGFWDKMVDRGVLHGSHETAWIRENVDGTHYYTHAYDREKMVAKSTQPLYGWLASANTMNPFERSYMLLKSDGFIDNLIKMGREQDAMQMQAMRQFVLENQNSSDPALREAAEEMYGYLTQLMGYMGSDRTGESPQMPQVAGFNAPLPDTPRPPVADNVEANRPMGAPSEHPMIGKSAIDMAWDMLQKKMRGGGGAVQLAGYPQSRERGDSRDGASLPPRQTTRHQIMREMEQGKREGAPELPYAIEEDDNIMEHKNKEALAELFGMRPKGRTIGDAM